MEIKNNEIHEGFVQVKDIRERIKTKMDNIRSVETIIRQTYIACIEKENADFFGLDSVHFQNKLINLESEGISRVYAYIDNRIYGDYYKLFTMMKDFLKESLEVAQFRKIKEYHHQQYPVYKDLEKFKVYEFDIVNNIHHDIVSVIGQMHSVYRENDAHINENKKKLYSGMNIDNYIINHQHLNDKIQMTTQLYSNYLSVYHEYHRDMLANFLEKIDLFYNQINKHIEPDMDSTEI
jgi:hypothetical protein